MSRKRLQELNWGSEQFSLQNGPMIWLSHFSVVDYHCLLVRYAALSSWQLEQVEVPGIFEEVIESGHSPFLCDRPQINWLDWNGTEPTAKALAQLFATIKDRGWHRARPNSFSLLLELGACLEQIPHKPPVSPHNTTPPPSPTEELLSLLRGAEAPQVWHLRERCRQTLHKSILPGTHRSNSEEYLEEMLSRGYVLSRKRRDDAPLDTLVLHYKGADMRLWEWALLEAKEEALMVFQTINSRFPALWQINYKE